MPKSFGTVQWTVGITHKSPGLDPHASYHCSPAQTQVNHWSDGWKQTQIQNILTLNPHTNKHTHPHWCSGYGGHPCTNHGPLPCLGCMDWTDLNWVLPPACESPLFGRSMMSCQLVFPIFPKLWKTLIPRGSKVQYRETIIQTDWTETTPDDDQPSQNCTKASL